MFQLVIKTKQNFRKPLSLEYVNTHKRDNGLEILMCEQLPMPTGNVLFTFNTSIYRTVSSFTFA